MLYLLTTLIFFSFSFNQINKLTISKYGKAEQKLILISGLACKNTVWSKTIKSLEKNNTLYALDFYTAKFSRIEEISKEIIRWIDKEKLKNVILIAHSLGAVVALDISSKIPKRIKKLVVVDAYPSFSALVNPNFKHKTDNDCSPFINQFSSMTKPQFEAFQKNNISQMTLSAQKQDELLGWFTNYNRHSYASLFCDYLNIDLRKRLASINCPSLILGSQKMRVFETKIIEQYKSLKESKIIFSEKGLHFLMFDDFKWYIKSIRGFINQ